MNIDYANTENALGPVAQYAATQIATATITLNVTWQTLPYNGPVELYLKTGIESIAIFRKMNGPVATLPGPASMQGIEYELVVYAPELAGQGAGGFVYGFAVNVTGSVTYPIELDRSVPPEIDTSIVGSVSGVTTLNGDGVARNVFVFALDDPENKLLAAVRTASNGAYTAAWYEYTGQVVAVALDDFGEPWQAGHDYVVGDIIYPPAGMLGVVYDCTAPGNSGPLEPIWWTAVGDSGAVGGATFVARAYARPLAHGPIDPAVTYA